MKHTTIRFKISVLYTAILGLILLGYSALLYVNLTYLITADLKKSLNEKAQAIEEACADFADVLEPDHEITPISLRRTISRIDTDQASLFEPQQLKQIDKEWQYAIHELGLNNDYVVIFYPTGELAEKTDNIPQEIIPFLESTVKPGIGAVTTRTTKVRTEHGILHVLVKPFYRDGKMRHILLVATPAEPMAAVLKVRFLVIAVTIPIVLLATSFLGRFFVIRTLSPIKEIAHTANTISLKDLSTRVKVALADDEIVALGNAFNSMLARLEASFKYIEDFSSNVAHELKTPLAIIRGEAEVVLRHSRNAEDYKRVLTINLEEVERMVATIEDLLLLTRLEYQTQVFKFEPVGVDEFFSDIIEQSKTIAAAKNIEVRSTLPSSTRTMEINRLHLRRLFFNLIDNAVKFTAPDGTITITVSCADEQVLVAIADTGIGIAEADMPRVYERFFHVDKTTWTNPPGSGLGLSIVQSIAQIHHGSVDVASRVGEGTTFTVTLPLA